ncbi:MAG: hypothetical protein KTR29_18500 [Rhodothermaceae bacterium]|nr:hypothetical protein [Rhodothermaceae bacterium]
MIYGQDQQTQAFDQQPQAFTAAKKERDEELLTHIKDMINFYYDRQREAERRGDRANAYRLNGAMGALSDLKQQIIKS